MFSLNENQNGTSFCTSKNEKSKAIVFGGPTASGKSALALRLAEKINGVIINADSMQVYREVPILTARPSETEMQKIDHRLYGFLDANRKCSAARWAQQAAEEMRRVGAEGKIPVFVGGTGLYIQTLEEGMSPIPEVSDEIRAAVRARFNAKGYEAFLAGFLKKDPSVRLTDPQRLLRAAEVFETTGKSIAHWQSLPPVKVAEADFFNVLVLPPRTVLYERCDARFERMVQSGAEEEVKELLAKSPPPDSLIMKAIGVKELSDFLRGETTREEAVKRARQMTRNYAKRQTTWFTRRFKADITVSDGNFEQILTKVLQFLS